MDMGTLKFLVGFSTCINHRESAYESILNMADDLYVDEYLSLEILYFISR